MKSSDMKETEPCKRVKDPVCGKEMYIGEHQEIHLYLGQTLYFCSPACQRLFRGNTVRYLKDGMRKPMAARR